MTSGRSNQAEARSDHGGARPPRGRLAALAAVGPGIVVAATGVGAGDLVAAAKAGASFGVVVLWAAALGSLLKLVLAEGVARWQLATGTTLIEGWFRYLGRPVRVYFTLFLVLWTFVVSAALMVACGLAAHALAPFLSHRLWAVLHGLGALALVWFEGYAMVERLMRWAVGLMFVTIVGTAIWRLPEPQLWIPGLVVPQVPAGGTLLVAGIMGGVGGTLTLLSYGYWLQEKRWQGPAWIRIARVDLTVGYGLTGLFALAVIILGHSVLLDSGVEVEGAKSVLHIAEMIDGGLLGAAGRWVFLIGFWGAVASSIVGVWQGVPYLFAHTWKLLREKDGGAGSSDAGAEAISVRSPAYRVYLLLMTFLPMVLILVERPVWLVVVYAALGSLFMPFLAATLLILNNRKSTVGRLANGPLVNLALVACLLLFAYLAVNEIASRLL